MQSSYHLALTIVPALTIMCWHVVFVVWGIDSLTSDHELHTTPFLYTVTPEPDLKRDVRDCAGAVHLWKYGFLNVFIAIFSVLSYFFFPAGGEGARARATLLTILHLALAFWGMSIWSGASATCNTVISQHFGEMYTFGRVCVWHNAVLFTLFLAHETFLGEELGVDLTLAAIFNKETSATYDYFQTEGAVPQDNTHIGPGQGAPGDQLLSESGLEGVSGPMSPGGQKSAPRPLHDGPPSQLDLYKDDPPSSQASF